MRPRAGDHVSFARGGGLLHWSTRSLGLAASSGFCRWCACSRRAMSGICESGRGLGARGARFDALTMRRWRPLPELLAPAGDGGRDASPACNGLGRFPARSRSAGREEAAWAGRSSDAVGMAALCRSRRAWLRWWARIRMPDRNGRSKRCRSGNAPIAQRRVPGRTGEPLPRRARQAWISASTPLPRPEIAAGFALLSEASCFMARAMSSCLTIDFPL